ncbi:MAG: hypothetical protein ACTTKF_08545, partial [Bacteroides sp.]
MAGVQGFVGAQHATPSRPAGEVCSHPYRGLGCLLLTHFRNSRRRRALVIGIFNRMVGFCRGAACYALSPCGRGMF